MITMKPILAQEVLDIFNQGRFAGELEGTIVSDGSGCTGHCLWQLRGTTAYILQARTQDPALLDGVIRASLAAAQDAGAAGFWVEDTSDELSAWRRRFCAGQAAPIPFEAVFHTCCADGAAAAPAGQ